MTEADNVSSGQEAAPEPEAPPIKQETLLDAIADLLQLFVNWLRQEAEALMRDKVIGPLQKLGLAITSSAAAGCLAVLGGGFLSVALLLLLAGWLGWIGALALIGMVLLAGSLAFMAVKVRSMQK